MITSVGTAVGAQEYGYTSPPDSPSLDHDGQRPLLQDSTAENDRDDSVPTDIERKLAERAAQPQFTARATILGLVIGTVIAFSNVYFGLQTGWISGMNMPASLLGFAFFKSASRFLKRPFSPVENVLLQSVSGSVGTMPLGCGIVAVIPALEYLLKPSENGPLHISIERLITWSVGLCLFGVVIAVPLRRQVIIKEKLKFPSGSATAVVIGILHGDEGDAQLVDQRERRSTDAGTVRGVEQITEDEDSQTRGSHENESPNLYHAPSSHTDQTQQLPSSSTVDTDQRPGNWQRKIKVLSRAFLFSAAYTLCTYFVPQIRKLPIFGVEIAQAWLWYLNPSPAYIGQGIIMGPFTTAHMLLGAILGWAILSPIAKYKGWAPGPVADWETGSKGWIVWVSLAIMLADSFVSLAFLVGQPLLSFCWRCIRSLAQTSGSTEWRRLEHSRIVVDRPREPTQHDPEHAHGKRFDRKDTDEEIDAPASHLVSYRKFSLWLILSISLYFLGIHLSFPKIIPFLASFLALLLAIPLSVMGVRALGSTDLNPVSGISKLTQLIFAIVIPVSRNPNSIAINILAGAVSEAGAVQAGDLLQDQKAGHLLGASPAAQFYGQLIGSVYGSIISAVVYRLYTRVYQIPGPLFQVPTAYVWIFTARLVIGEGLPPMAAEFAWSAAVLWVLITTFRTLWQKRKPWWLELLPSGIAVAVGMYNTPDFTIARAIGGLLYWWWTKKPKRTVNRQVHASNQTRAWTMSHGGDETTVIVLASGLILGEGLCSIINLVLASSHVPHI